jgi:hypothetical protein
VIVAGGPNLSWAAVSEKCIMCHAIYTEAIKGEAIGALRAMVSIE